MLLNILTFQLGWFACILGAANNYPWLGVLVSMCLLAWHLAAHKHWINEGRLILLAMLIGAIFDFVPLSLGWISFKPLAFWPSQLPPPWMIFLWGMFATTLNISLSWLKPKILMATIIGGIAGPLAYWSGTKLEAITLVDFRLVMIYLAIGWAIAVPVLLKIASSSESFTHLIKNGER